MIRINLLPVRAAQKKERLRGQVIILVLAIAVVLVACGGVYFSLLSKVSAEKEEITRKDSEINNLKSKIGEVGRFKKLQEELRGKLEVLEKLKEAKKGPVRLLDELSTSLSEKVWITSFKESAGAISISGIGLSEETVADFLRRLESSPYYQKVELQVVEQTSQQGTRLHKFDLTCRVEIPSQKTP